jgi:hypothetical protein
MAYCALSSERDASCLKAKTSAIAEAFASLLSSIQGHSSLDHYTSMNGAMMYPREVCFSLSPYFSTLAGRAGQSFSASAKAHSIKQMRDCS